MNCSPVTSKELSQLPGMDEYTGYYIDIRGHLYSTKYNKCNRIKTYKTKRGKRTYLLAQLTNGKGRRSSFYLHRLVALAFLPNPDNSWGIEHIDGNIENNSIENLRWIRKKREGLTKNQLNLSEEMSDYIKLVHYSAVLKGIPVPTDYEFFHGMLNESLEEFINRYGLRKTMYQLQNS
jgi:hypothetical protein